MSVIVDPGAIAAAIAARFVGITPPTGYDPVTESTHLLPQNITTTPCVHVGIPEMELRYPPSAVAGNLTYPVRFYIAPTKDRPAAVAAFYAWAPILLARFVGQVSLGLSADGVTHATVSAFRAGPATYGGTEYLAFEQDWTVHIAKGVDFTA